MAVTDLTLPKPMVVIRQVDSLLGLQYAGSKMKSAIIDNIYETSDLNSVGDIVVFNSTQGEKFQYGSTNYILIDEKYIFGNEGAPT